MAQEINPPVNDDLIIRHAFYSKVASQITAVNKDIDSIASNLREFLTDFETIKDLVKSTEVRNKTIISIIVLVWTVVGGSVCLYIQKGIENYDKQNLKITALETSIDKQKVEFDNYKANTLRDFEDIKNLIALRTQNQTGRK